MSDDLLWPLRIFIAPQSIVGGVGAAIFWALAVWYVTHRERVRTKNAQKREEAMRGTVSTLHNIIAAAEPQTEDRAEECARCNAEINEFVAFDAQKMPGYGDFAPNGERRQVVLCHTCWSSVLDFCWSKSERSEP